MRFNEIGQQLRAYRMESGLKAEEISARLGVSRAAIQPVLNPDDIAIFNQAVGEMRYQPPVNGGATRQASVHAGLEALADHAPPRRLILGQPGLDVVSARVRYDALTKHRIEGDRMWPRPNQ